MLDRLTPTAVRALVGAKVYARGEASRHGSVASIRLLGDTLHAVVRGQSSEAYHVRVRFARGGVGAATCTCPYVDAYGAPCKHIAAALLCALRKPPATAPSLDTRLDGLDAPALRALVHRLLDAAPTLLDELDELIDDAEFAPRRRPPAHPPGDAPTPHLLALLDAGRHAEAIALLGPAPDDLLALTVGEAVAETHPEWVIARAERFAETHVDTGHAAQYDEAARWLIAARRACLARNRPAQWREMLATARERYHRRPAFLRALDARPISTPPSPPSDGRRLLTAACALLWQKTCRAVKKWDSSAQSPRKSRDHPSNSADFASWGGRYRPQTPWSYPSHYRATGLFTERRSPSTCHVVRPLARGAVEALAEEAGEVLGVGVADHPRHLADRAGARGQEVGGAEEAQLAHEAARGETGQRLDPAVELRHAQVHVEREAPGVVGRLAQALAHFEAGALDECRFLRYERGAFGP